ncbi:hypothetical protein MMC31_006639 [Peltigera leucophlebia]|nr:hypothetical protein [Peltigera leucophlebia]
MESAGLRHREEASEASAPVPAVDINHDYDLIGDLPPPRYTVDLSLPPRERYQHVVRDFKPQMSSLPILFDDILRLLHPNIPVQPIQQLARVFLRHVHNPEETEELRGIQEETGIEMYLLVAFNVLLDLLMGCTSGGARVPNGSGLETMLHFRTLDWSMDPLRKVVVHLDFIEKSGGILLASAITYVGYVGVLTGVRQGLSMSLNFRPNHNKTTGFSNFQFYFHHLLVLLGFRPSISSLLRQMLLPSLYSSPVAGSSASLDSIERKLPKTKSTAAYLIFSDGNRTMTLEKDHMTAVVTSSDNFIVACNHDASFDHVSKTSAETLDIRSNALKLTGKEDLIEESVDRKRSVTDLWKHSSTRKKSKFNIPSHKSSYVTTKNVIEWMDTYPIRNESTHYGVVMDPKKGKVIWIKSFLEPFDETSQSTNSSGVVWDPVT